MVWKISRHDMFSYLALIVVRDQVKKSLLRNFLYVRHCVIDLKTYLRYKKRSF